MINHLPSMTDEEIERVRKLEKVLMELPQVPLETTHTLHGNTYSRTIKMPAGTALVGALLKIPTTLIVNGKCTVYIGNETIDLEGCHVLPAEAGRKQAFVAHADTYLTMFCATAAKTIDEVETEMTDETALLASRREDASNQITITGEQLCLVQPQ